MTDHDVRVLDAHEHRAAVNLVRHALHFPPVPEDDWPQVAPTYSEGRVWGAHAGDELVGTAASWASRLAVPGGRELPLAAVIRVGVRPDHTRRGVLSALMRHQLAEFRERGEVLAALHASEPVIYGRYGYGPATRARTVSVRAGRDAIHPEALSGRVSVVAPEDASDRVRAVYDRVGLVRPGMVARTDEWWTALYVRALATGANLRTAVHVGADGEDGFVTWKPLPCDNPTRGVVLQVEDLHAATPAAAAALWAFVLGIDLVKSVRAEGRPVDEPLEWLLTNPRLLSTEAVDDDLWVRLVDVPAALDARSWGEAEPVVVEVADRVLPDNAGRYRVAPDGVRRTDAPADLELDVAELGALYLGDVPPSVLASAGRIAVRDAAALARADRLFAVGGSPWCGSFF
ncbi:putative acetyltransferase [Streptoalloteichus tenebrarius]|uniref:Acetyltransferase n=1 Tax=Streptoalloteichus tenebrarius (strain ATCC 17920 / DSM 40477 / JCM 4838 / CBS 697.72 / NBRC 16177 / NCIMB 11028 / NRRL B-12390 / A12253. 1 / ISP 5477) TaxID=1933 RepID=A0ABT1HPA3_STRSD|nr:GNAT family N-acetyltransferase [Streptoalloteichus tenebrarius]MCP2257339.1 putative acetyltransferase [Streptoalloteichus tenebrarius]BFF04248.1 GNAT family N-acetyltransferase [Streptoalloteichus tenebrarius]